MNAPDTAAADIRPAEIDVMVANHCVVLIVDPDTAQLIAREHELAANMGIFDDDTRPQWRRESDRIAAAAAVARRRDLAEETADVLLAAGVTPLRPFRVESR